MLTIPSKGMRKEKKGSCDPSNRSFFVKSIADSVAFPRHRKRPVEACSGGAALDLARDRAKKDIASRRRGREERKQRSMLSAKVINTPIET